jgi:hypothetical protein
MKLPTGWKLFSISFALTVPFFAFVITRMVKESRFDDACSYHLEQATSLSFDDDRRYGTTYHIEVDKLNDSIQHIDIALKYAQDHNLTTGFTTISGRNPSEDLSVWYKAISDKGAYLRYLRELPPGEIEKHNEFVRQMNLQSKEILSPGGISIYPYNTTYFIWLLISMALAVLGVVGIIVLITEKSES